MFKQDIIMAPMPWPGYETHWRLYIITDKGREMATKHFGRLAIVDLGNGLASAEIHVDTAQSFSMQFRDDDLEIVYISANEMSIEVVEMNAKMMALDFQMEKMRGEVAAHFTPLIDAAIEAKDGKECKRLFYALPREMSVEKSFIAMNICEKFGVKTIDGL